MAPKQPDGIAPDACVEPLTALLANGYTDEDGSFTSLVWTNPGAVPDFDKPLAWCAGTAAARRNALVSAPSAGRGAVPVKSASPAG